VMGNERDGIPLTYYLHEDMSVVFADARFKARLQVGEPTEETPKRTRKRKKRTREAWHARRTKGLNNAIAELPPTAKRAWAVYREVRDGDRLIDRITNDTRTRFPAIDVFQEGKIQVVRLSEGTIAATPATSLVR